MRDQMDKGLTFRSVTNIGGVNDHHEWLAGNKMLDKTLL